jgi:PEP-CTERM/exosortase A-associated glycosyltransferase
MFGSGQSQLRILHVFDHSIPLHSGYTFRSEAIIRQQRQRGWQTFHLTSPKHYLDCPPLEMVEGLNFYRTPQPTCFLSKFPGLGELMQIGATARRIGEVIEEVRPDILHAHSPVLNGLAAARAARRYNLPFVYEIRAFWEDAAAAHGTCREGDLRYWMTQSMETHVVKRADAVAVICDGLKSDLVGRGVNPEKITIIPNGVDLEAFAGPTPRDEALCAALRLQGKSVLGFIGSFYPYEGLAVLLKSLPLIIDRMPETRLLLVGGGPQEDELKALAHSLGISDKVIFTGRVPHNDVQRYYSVVDLFVYPRSAMRLTELVTPLKPLEAMAQHQMVAASDVGGHRELIEDGVTGTLFKPDDPEALADAVVKLFADRTGWPERLETARRFVERERNWEKSVANYERVYAAALKNRK